MRATKSRKKLTFQICTTILITNLLTLLLCFVFQNVSIQNILLRNSERESVNRFEQSEYNILTFCGQMDLVSRNLSANANLRTLSRYNKLSEKDKIAYVKTVMDSFEEEMNNYSYIRNISYYGDNGVIITTGSEGNYIQYDKDKTDWFYESAICKEMSSNNLALRWFGGYTNYNFYTSVQNLDGIEKTHYITAVRNVLAGSGKLILNVDMTYFCNIFFVDKDDTEENIYMIDENDRVIAAQEKELIGEIRSFSQEEVVPRNKIAKCTTNSDQGEIQVILYPLESIQMRLVSEKPVKEVTNDSRYLKNILLFTCLSSILVSFFISRYGISKKLKPLNRLVEGLQRVGEGQLGCVLEKGPDNEIGTLTEQFNQMSTELKKTFEQNQKMAEEKSRLEMQALRSQINPHLIYNTLNNIKWMALINNEKNIAESITLLSDFLEPVFKNRSNLCTVEEEINYVKNYISIMNLRVAGGYTLELAIPEEYYPCTIIRFLLQPIVENSILHGMGERSSGVIRISMWNAETDGFIQVEDDGQGIEESVLLELQKRMDNEEVKQENEDGVGVINVSHRIKVQYGENYGITIRNRKEGGTAVILKIRLS